MKPMVNPPISEGQTPALAATVNESARAFNDQIGVTPADEEAADSTAARFPFLGNASVRIARVEHARAQRLQKLVTSIASERDELQRKLADLDEQVSGALSCSDLYSNVNI